MASYIYLCLKCGGGGETGTFTLYNCLIVREINCHLILETGNVRPKISPPSQREAFLPGNQVRHADADALVHH